MSFPRSPGPYPTLMSPSDRPEPGNTSVQPDLLPGPTITARLQFPPGADRALGAPGPSEAGRRVGAEQDCPPGRVQDAMKVTMEKTQPLETAGAPCPSCLPTSSSCALKPGGLEAHPLTPKATAAPHPICWEGVSLLKETRQSQRSRAVSTLHHTAAVTRVPGARTATKHCPASGAALDHQGSP